MCSKKYGKYLNCKKSEVIYLQFKIACVLHFQKKKKNHTKLIFSFGTTGIY